MSELAPLIEDLAVILGIASLVVLLFQRLKQAVVLIWTRPFVQASLFMQQSLARNGASYYK